jgi:alpha-L-fucosidase
MFVAQLTELLTNYGRIDEVWFDGACGEGPNGKKQVYDWTRFKETIASLQPDAVVAIMGDDVRWVGNEKGQGRETEWSATALTPGIYTYAAEANSRLELFAKAPDLGGRAIVAKADKLYWWPSEVDVSIRPGWFYHEKENPRTLAKLAEIYLTSVGRNSVLLLNIPPDTHGRIHTKDVNRLLELRQWIDTNFSNNLVVKSKNGIYSLGSSQTINTVVLTENIAKGQRVESFNVMARHNGLWTAVASGTTIGHKRIITFDDTKADAVRIDITSSRGKTDINVAGVHAITMPQDSDETLAGYTAIDAKSITAIPTSATAAIDGNKTTYWQSAQGVNSLTIDMNTATTLSGFIYTPRAGEDKSGTIFKYRLLSSLDGSTWSEIPTSGEFSNIVNNPIDQQVFFNAPVVARFVKIECLQEIESRNYISVGNITLLTATKK